MDKSIDEIYEEMLSVFGETSGYLPSASCDLAARMYAAAAQIQGLYLQAQWLLDQSFPQTAKGEYLERHAQLRGLSRGIATCAAGVLRFGLSTAVGSDLTIKSGTVCMTASGVRFATTDQAALKSGLLYVDVPAVALEPGKKGNVAAGSVTIMAAMPVGITACTNPAAFSGGDDAEDDEALRRRLLDSYRRLPNGANAAYYEQTALSCTGPPQRGRFCRPLYCDRCRYSGRDAVGGSQCALAGEAGNFRGFAGTGSHAANCQYFRRCSACCWVYF